MELVGRREQVQCRKSEEKVACAKLERPRVDLIISNLERALDGDLPPVESDNGRTVDGKRGVSLSEVPGARRVLII